MVERETPDLDAMYHTKLRTHYVGLADRYPHDIRIIGLALQENNCSPESAMAEYLVLTTQETRQKNYVSSLATKKKPNKEEVLEHREKLLTIREKRKTVGTALFGEEVEAITDDVVATFVRRRVHSKMNTKNNERTNQADLVKNIIARFSAAKAPYNPL